MALARVEREMAAAGQGCLGKAADDEPVFILRGQDAHADAVVKYWAALARSSGCSTQKIVEAEALADAMSRWRPRKYPD